MCLEIELEVQLFDLVLHGRILPAIVIVEDLSLLWSNEFKSFIDQPSALIIQDVGTDLPDVFWVTVAVKVIILYLEVLAEWNEDITSACEVLGCCNAGLVHCQSDGKIERIKCGLVTDDEVVFLVVEPAEVDTVFWSSEKVDELTKLSLPGNLMAGSGVLSCK